MRATRTRFVRILAAAILCCAAGAAADLGQDAAAGHSAGYHVVASCAGPATTEDPASGEGPATTD